MKAFYTRPSGTTARLFQDLADYHGMQDKWGATMGLFFDVAGEMGLRDMPIPDAWGYRPSPFGHHVSEDNEDVMQGLSSDDLARLGAFCHRLTGRLERAGLDY